MKGRLGGQDQRAMGKAKQDDDQYDDDFEDGFDNEFDK